MRRSLITLAALTAPLLLASCSAVEDGSASASTPAPIKTVTITATPTPSLAPAANTVEEVYLAQLRETHSSLSTAPDDGLIGIGEGVCEIYDKGNGTDDVNDFLAIGAGVAYTLHELASMHGAAVAALCPEHLGTLQESASNG